MFVNQRELNDNKMNGLLRRLYKDFMKLIFCTSQVWAIWRYVFKRYAQLFGEFLHNHAFFAKQ